jgi:hypothetical protein
LLDQVRGGVSRLAYAQADGAVARAGGDARVQLAKALKGIGLQSPEQGIHRSYYQLLKWPVKE